jgi:hypothetical protein
MCPSLSRRIFSGLISRNTMSRLWRYLAPGEVVSKGGREEYGGEGGEEALDG